MEQLSVEIRSAHEAKLIKELLKQFKSVDVMSFTPAISRAEMSKRIKQGLKDADAGRVSPWKDVKKQLLRKITA